MEPGLSEASAAVASQFPTPPYDIIRSLFHSRQISVTKLVLWKTLAMYQYESMSMNSYRLSYLTLSCL